MKSVIPHTEGFYVSASKPAANQECVNWYTRPNEGLVPEILFGSPGLEQRATTGSSGTVNRGAHTFNEIPYFVQGETLYSLERTIDANGDYAYSLAQKGLISGTGRVSIADNGTQMMLLVPGGNGYIYDGTDLNQITDSDFLASGSPQYVLFLDGYFVCYTDEKKFIISALNDGTSWNALDRGTAESDPDKINGMGVIRNQLYIFGTQTAEGFENIGGSDFPFQRIAGSVVSKGCKAPFSVVEANDVLFMIGAGVNEAPAILAFDGSSYTKISPPGIDLILGDANLTDAFAYQYSKDGNHFICFALPETTICYDLATQRWHERKSQINGNATRSRVNSLTEAYDQILVGDSQDGRIGTLSNEIYTEYGDEIIRTIVAQPFAAQNNSVSLSALEMTFESGVGGADEPEIMLVTSRDGRTWGQERIIPFGKVGEYSARAIARRLGRFPRFGYVRISLSDAVKPVFIQLIGDFNVHTH